MNTTGSAVKFTCQGSDIHIKAKKASKMMTETLVRFSSGRQRGQNQMMKTATPAQKMMKRF
jgi:hypothetical protein